MSSFLLQEDQKIADLKSLAIRLRVLHPEDKKDVLSKLNEYATAYQNATEIPCKAR